MPSGGLAQFVKSQGQDDADSPNERDLARRRNIAANAKVQPTTFYRATSTQSHVEFNRRTVPSVPKYVQPPRSQEEKVGDLFAGSVLSDSDDTTRDLGSSNIREYQAMLSPQLSQNIGRRNETEQHSPLEFLGEFGDEEEENDYPSDGEVLQNDPSDEDGHSHAFNFPADTVPIDNGFLKQALRLRESQQFAEAEKLHNSKFSSSHVAPIHPSISGRFTAANKLAGDGHKHLNGFGSTAQAHYRFHQQRKDQLSSEDVANDESDEQMGRANFQQNGQKCDGQPTQASVATEHHFNGEEQPEDRFRASEIGSEYSGGSSEPSPSQHTPRANGQSHKQTPTSSQTGKRKKAVLELDYGTDTLSTLKYSELKNQPFDSNPKAPLSIIPEFLSGPEASLEVQLQHFKDSETSDQSRFFAQMPLEEWERSGDWFLGRFGDIMSKLKDARRAKRDVSKAFEEELATREEAVRAKAEGIQEVFKQMRAGGEGVLKGRAP